MKKNLKTFGIIFLILSVVVATGIYTFKNYFYKTTPTSIEALLENQKEMNASLIPEKVYAHTDKPFYSPGETVWYTAYIRNGQDFSPSQKTEIVRAELYAPSGSLEQSLKVLTTSEGIAKGHFELDKNLKGGSYELKFYSEWQQNETNPAFFTKKIEIQPLVLPSLKLALDFVKEGYRPGDEVLASVTMEDNKNKALAKKSFTYAVKRDGTTVDTYKGVTDDKGKATLTFVLPNETNTSEMLLDVTLSYQGKNEGISRYIPITRTEVSLDFFPEGGDMIKGLSSNVAFKATDAQGNAVDIQGKIVDEKGKQVATFESFHKGMGMFNLKPIQGIYKAQITHPSGILKNFDLPTPKSTGFTLAVKESDSQKLPVTIGASKSGQVTLVATMRGVNYLNKTISVSKGENNTFLSLAELPAGVAQITLFDENGVAMAERLAFVNRAKLMNIEINTDKNQYQPREKVELSIKTSQADGTPTSADISLAVVDDQLLSYADDKSSNLLSWMLVESEIKQKVEEPSFYFDNENEKANQALDYLLMTAGWRRFSWEEIAKSSLPKMEYLGERKAIAGHLIDQDGNPIKKAKIMINENARPLAPDERGYFEIKNYDLAENPSINLAISSPTHYRREYTFAEYGTHDIKLYSRNLSEGEANILIAEELRDDDDTEERTFSNRGAGIGGRSTFQVKSGKKRWNNHNQNAAADEDAEIIINLQDNRINIKGNEEVATLFQRVREFPKTNYENSKSEKRTDFRSTVFWEGNLRTDEKGEAKVTFYNTDAITSFKVTAEGISQDGVLGHSAYAYHTELPFSLSAKIPVDVVAGDKIQIPVTLTNNTSENINGTLTFDHPRIFDVLETPSANIQLKGNETKTIYLKYQVKNTAGIGQEDDFEVRFKSPQFSDAISEKISVIPEGFPITVAFSGTGKETQYQIQIAELEENSLDVEVEAFPSTLSELMKGAEGIFQLPHGCFEQTSSYNYPNILALQYMEETDQVNPDIYKKANAVLAQGYKRLKSFECSGGGFEWFGQGEANEVISAFAVMQLTHLKQVYPEVEQNIIDRTVAWLKTRQQGNGSFRTSERLPYSFGVNANKKALYDTYIMYCLSEAKVKGFDSTLKKVLEQAENSNNPYQTVLASLIFYNYEKNKKADALLAKTKQLFEENQEEGQTLYGTVSGGYQTEMNALLLLAECQKENLNIKEAKILAEKVRNGKTELGRFGNTQTTMFALRALTSYTKFARETAEDGTIQFYVNGKMVASKDYKKGEKETIVIRNLASHFGEGVYDFAVKYEGTNQPLPHTVTFHYNSKKPRTDDDFPIAMESSIQSEAIKVGSTARMNVSLFNRTSTNQNMPLAIVGIPAGLSPQAWQLKELVDNETIAYYEISNNSIILYLRNLKSKERKDIALDMKADFAGTFNVPASCAFPYYNDNQKYWNKATPVTILN